MLDLSETFSKQILSIVWDAIAEAIFRLFLAIRTKIAMIKSCIFSETLYFESVLGLKFTPDLLQLLYTTHS